MANFGWNYPPGVTGNEYEINGPDYQDSIGFCPECGEEEWFEEGHQGDRWNYCYACDHYEDLEPFELEY